MMTVNRPVICMMVRGQGERSWDWGLYPEAERFVRQQVTWFLDRYPGAERLAHRIERRTSTQFGDWIDHLVIPENRVEVDDLLGLGYRERKGVPAGGARVFSHFGGTLVPLLLAEDRRAELALSPEDLGDFSAALGITAEIEGEPHAPVRKVVVGTADGLCLSAVERRGGAGFITEEWADGYEEVLGLLASRSRRFASDARGMETCASLVAEARDRLSAARLADAFLRCERRYWESRNTAGRKQKQRQDTLGLGWGNHDHHTFRSSREQFASLIRIFELMGFSPRERFHAGAEAGWGAQVLEQPDAGLVVFADVDLSEEERDADFARAGLVPRRNRGTVGLWVALHGESILQAGMHHLAARLRFDTAQNDLAALGIRMMQPFSYFPFLKQAFSEAELWKAESGRAAGLVERAILSSRQAMEFVGSGALGSHLENIQRGQGFRGFNQTSVSVIIRATDPRGEGERSA
jgi:hypothetical protein